MKHDPIPFELTPDDVVAIGRARADVAAGRVIPHDDVAEWLSRWGTPDETPMPPEWLR